MRNMGLCLTAGLAFAIACGSNPADSPPQPFELTSSAFVDSGPIPFDNSLQGENNSPPLAWTGAPDGCLQFALTCVDLTAGGFVHWVVYEIPADMAYLLEGVPPGFAQPYGTFSQGLSGYGGIGYGGPNPPPGEIHFYLFTLYALDQEMALGDSLTASELEQAIEGRVLGTACLTGTYELICNQPGEVE